MAGLAATAIWLSLSLMTRRCRAGQALSANYVKVELAAPREPKRLAGIEVGGLTAHGVRERPVFSILPV